MSQFGGIERPGPWETAGDHERRIRALEAYSDCCDDIPEGILSGCPTVELAYRNPGDLTAWWRCGETFTFASTVSDAFVDTSDFDATVRNLDYLEDWDDERPTLHITDPDLGTGDDGAVQFNSTTFTDGQYFRSGAGLTTAFEQVARFGQSADLARSVVCRIKPNNILTTFEQPYVGIWGMEGTGSVNVGWVIDVTSLVLKFKAWASSNPDITLETSGTLTAEQWYSVAVTWDGATWKLYLDGVLVDSAAGTTAPDNPSSGNSLFSLGYGVYDQGVSDRPHYCNGGLDEVALYKKVLSASEILTIAQSSGSGTTPQGFCAGTIDSTENVGDVFGVHSEDGTTPEPEGYVLTADGEGGSLWAPATATGSFAERILAQPTLVGYWPMDDASGDAHDESSNDRPLPPIGTPTYGEPGALATTDQTSILLEGVNHSGSLPTDDSFLGEYDALNLNGGDMTAMCLIYPTAFPAIAAGITFFGSGGTPAHIIQLRPDGQIFWSVASTQQTQSGVSVPLNQWTHVACTRNASALAIYFNGVLVASGTTEAIADSAADDFIVGALVTAANQVRYYNGRVAHVALFNDDLSATTIASIAQSGVQTAPGISLVRTAGASATLSYADEVVLVTTTATITLPTAVGWTGKRFEIKNTSSSSTVTIARTSSQTIDGANADLSLAAKDMVTLMSDGTGWQILGSYP